MSDISNANPVNLPTSKQLLRSTIIAIMAAGALLVTVVMPAEYGLDPTGVGNVLGLTEMGRIKVALAKEVETAEAPSAERTRPLDVPSPAAAASPAGVESDMTSSSSASTARSDTTAIALAPGQGREIKLDMRRGERVNFSWATDRGVVNYDMHADSVVPKRDYFGYRKGKGVPSDRGELVAAFDGSHGWFWRNRGRDTVTVTLRTEGEYSTLTEKK